MGRSYVVTGAGRGVGRAVVERLLTDGDTVVAIEFDAQALAWAAAHPARDRLCTVAGDAREESVAERAAGLAQEAGPLAGWVNNAAVFRDAALHSAAPQEVLDLVALNLAPVVTGCSVAVRRFLAAGTGGAIVNISSHQAQRPVPGCLPYATAKSAIEGLTRALAVDYGPDGIRTNALALGSITTERYEALLSEQGPEQAARTEHEMGLLHPLGRVGRPEEVAAATRYLLSSEAGFINGAILPVDGGRSVLARDPEARTGRPDSPQ